MQELPSEDYVNVKRSRVKIKRDEYLNSQVAKHADLFKSWYLQTCFKYLKESNLRYCEENVIEDFSDYVTQKLDELEKLL